MSHTSPESLSCKIPNVLYCCGLNREDQNGSFEERLHLRIGVSSARTTAYKLDLYEPLSDPVISSLPSQIQARHLRILWCSLPQIGMSESTERTSLLLTANEGSSGSFRQDSSYNGDRPSETETEDANAKRS